MKKRRSQKSAKNEADRLFSLIIRSRGYCERCGKTTTLQCSHIHPRSINRTRCDEENAFCFCAGCHLWWHANPSLTAEFVYSRMPSDRVKALNLRARPGMKIDWNDEVDRLAARWQELEQ